MRAPRSASVLLLLGAAACRPAPIEPSAPVAVIADRPGEPRPAAPAVASSGSEVAAPAPATTPASDPPPTWDWAVSVLPELATHSEVDPAPGALARFLAWFPGGAGRVHVLLEGRCHAISGEFDADGFHGGWQRRVTVTGDAREVTVMDFSVTRHGVSESGPGGKVYDRDERGRWREAGAFATGRFRTLVDRPMSAADERQVTFAGYWYRLEPVCRAYEAIEQTCADGSARRCRRCTALAVEPRADNHSWRTPTVTVGRVGRVAADCSRPCPVDERAALLPRLAEVLKDRSFAGTDADAGPAVFRTAKGCDRERRRGARSSGGQTTAGE